jgi:hypothetical protein
MGFVRYAKTAADTVRIMGRVTPEVNEELGYWARELGIGKTAIVSMCIRSGLGNVIRILAPEKLLGEDEWATILKIAEKTPGGVPEGISKAK